MHFSTPVRVFRWTFIESHLLGDKTIKAKLMAAGGRGGPSSGTQSQGGPQFRPSPRFVSTHLPFSMNNPRLLDVCKVVYVARNPKDACVSFFNFSRLVKMLNFTGDLEVRPPSVVQLAIGISVGHRRYLGRTRSVPRQETVSTSVGHHRYLGRRDASLESTTHFRDIW